MYKGHLSSRQDNHEYWQDNATHSRHAEAAEEKAAKAAARAAAKAAAKAKAAAARKEALRKLRVL